MTRRYYSSAAAATTLSSSATSGATSITVGATTGFPVQFPYTLILDPETAAEEVVTVTSAAGTTLTVTRGSDGTTALAHTSGAVVKHGVSARDFDEPNEHIDTEIGVHGITGSVVGTSDTQTLTGKTIDLTDNTVVGTLAEFNAAVQGDDLVGLAATQTLTNKTLTSPVIGGTATGLPVQQEHVAKAYGSGVLSLTTATWTVAPFDTVAGGSGVTVASSSRVTVSATGLYRVSVRGHSTSNNLKSLAVMVRKGAAGAFGGGTLMLRADDTEGSVVAAGFGRTVAGDDLMSLTAGDYLEAFFIQDSGGTYALDAGLTGASLSVELVRPA